MPKDSFKSTINTLLQQGLQGTCPEIDPQPRALIDAMVTSGSETVQLVALTNLAVIAVLPHLSACTLHDPKDPINRRGLYKSAVRPALIQMIEDAGLDWQPSKDPYASNPFKDDKINEAWVEERNKKLKGAEELLGLLCFVDEHKDKAGEIAAALLHGMRDDLQLQITMPLVPPRVTTEQLKTILRDWPQTPERRDVRLVVIVEHILADIGAALSKGWASVTHDTDRSAFVCGKGGVSSLIATLCHCDDSITAMHSLAKIALDKRSTRGLLIMSDDTLPAEADTLSVQEYYCNLGIQMSFTTIDRLLETWLPMTAAGLSHHSELLTSIASSDKINAADRSDLSDVIYQRLLPQLSDVA